MILLTLDPSSTTIGYCISTGPGKLLDAGKIKSSKPDMFGRLRIMLPELDSLIDKYDITHVLIETPAPQSGNKKNNRGQATYGMAVGRVFERLETKHGLSVEYTPADEWTNRVSKANRQAWIAEKYRSIGYRIESDRGGDVSDAIGLADWWWVRQGGAR